MTKLAVPLYESGITSLLLSSQDFPTFLTGQPDSVQCCKTFDEPGAEVGIIFQTIAVCLPPCLHRSHAFGLPMKNPDYPRFYLNWLPRAFQAQECFYDFTFGVTALTPFN